MNDNNVNTNPENGLNNNEVPGVTPVPETVPVTPVPEVVPVTPMPEPVVEAVPVTPMPEPAVEAVPVTPMPEPVVEAVPVAPMPEPVVEAVPVTPMPEPVIGTEPTMTLGDNQPAQITPDTNTPPVEPSTTPTETTTPAPEKKNNPIVVVLLLIVIIGIAGYGVYTYLIKDKNNTENIAETCSVLTNYTGTITGGEYAIVSLGEQSYNFKSSNIDLFKAAFNYDTKVDVNVCIAGNDITGYTLINKLDNSTMTATTENELRSALNLKAFGKYTETATLISKDTNPITGLGNDNKVTTGYNLTFKLDNEEEVVMLYQVLEGTKFDINTLVENKTYNIEYEVAAGTFEVEYTLSSIK